MAGSAYGAPRYADASDEHHTLARAVRAAVHRQVIDLLAQRGLLDTADLMECPSCGDRVIVLDQPATFTFDPAARAQICAACSAERDFLRLALPDDDIGGEGGA